MRFSNYKIFKDSRCVREIFESFKDDRLPFLLESSQNICGMGRFSFFGSEPFLTLSYCDGFCIIDGPRGTKKIRQRPLEVLRKLLKKYSLEGASKLSSVLLCGAVGFFSYDFGFSIENIKRRNRTLETIPDMKFAFYDCIVSYDHLLKEVTVFSSGFPENGLLRRKRSILRLSEVEEKIKKRSLKFSVKNDFSVLENIALIPNFTKMSYVAGIKKAKDYIARGDIYQVNLSQMFKVKACLDDWQLYKRLIEKFPVSFSAFFKDRTFSIISASPEKFLSFDGRKVTTRPMKGTRKRTQDPLYNRKLRRELLSSKKERAELLMVVDLERNDLGRVCDYGSIKVDNLRMIESYSNLFQATAEVSGILHKDKDIFDLIRATFPGGSITGCPKIRAMEIIEELEPDTRSIYTGALGYISFHDTMQLNILIRTFLKIGNDISFHVGGGIVADSDPKSEYEETLIKGRALMEALKGG